MLYNQYIDRSERNEGGHTSEGQQMNEDRGCTNEAFRRTRVG